MIQRNFKICDTQALKKKLINGIAFDPFYSIAGFKIFCEGQLFLWTLYRYFNCMLEIMKANTVLNEHEQSIAARQSSRIVDRDVSTPYARLLEEVNAQPPFICRTAEYYNRVNCFSLHLRNYLVKSVRTLITVFPLKIAL